MEEIYIDALLKQDNLSLSGLIDTNGLYTNEYGQQLVGKKEIRPYIRLFEVLSIEVLERRFRIEGNTAHVVTLERRLHNYCGVEVYQKARFNRIWRLNGSKWQLIFASKHRIEE